MNRKIVVFVVGLLALGALEFGLLGANAAGFGGGGQRRLPPLAERNVRRTPVASPMPALPRSADSIELHRPDPDAIPCDGTHRSSLSVEVRDSLGKPAKDGTNVLFAVYNGSADPPIAQTRRGAASTSIILYSDAYSSRPNVEVRSGDMETAIRVRCIPNSGCPLSPSPNASPPCGPTPFPCNPSPGSGPMSPPCQVVPPPSPPICAPNQTSPPCTPLSPPPCKPVPTSPQCATATPSPECAPFVPVSPPCAPPTPQPCDPNAPLPPFCPPVSPPGSPPMLGGKIYLGTPTLIDGKIRVPVSVTDSPDPYLGFSVSVRFDTSIAAFVDFQLGDVVEAVTPPGGIACALPTSPAIAGATCFIEPQPANVSGARTLAFVSLAPLASSGCLPLHLVTFWPPDLGKIDRGTYTIGRTADDVVEVQLNTYGPDVFVNIADGSACVPSGCISFDPAGCGPEATPTPPGSDAQTATATALRTSTPAATSSQVAATSTATPLPRRQ